MQPPPQMSVLLMVLALATVAMAKVDDWEDPALTGSNMGLRILKRDGNFMRVGHIKGSALDEDENIFCWNLRRNKSHGSYPILMSTFEHYIIFLKCNQKDN